MPTIDKNFVYNSERWSQLAFRDGDIIIATPSKCGTTWTQMITALLIFDTAELPAPLARISPWLDMNTRPLDDVLAELDAQTHRRFVKSHLAFDALPQDDRIAYITVGRDPRDVALSWSHHLANMDIGNFLNERVAAVGVDDLADLPVPELPPEGQTEVDAFWHWIEGDTDDSFTGMNGMLNHLKSFWLRRTDPNVVMLHYADLQRDLVGQMAYLAERLGLERSRERLEELAPAAQFEQMKASAERVAPNADQTFWKSTSDFFHKGTSGQWREIMTDAELPRYESRLNALAEPEFIHWLHNGSLS